MNFFKNGTEMLRRKPAQKQLGSFNLIKLYNISNHLDVIFSDLLPILRVTSVLMRSSRTERQKLIVTHRPRNSEREFLEPFMRAIFSLVLLIFLTTR